MKQLRKKGFFDSQRLIQIVAIVWLPVLWLLVKSVLGVSDRYLPHPVDVFITTYHLGSSLIGHAIASFSRIFVGYLFACGLSIYVGAWLYRSKLFEQFAMPVLQTIRAVPATATIPFFILWFGFSETGKLLIIVVGISFNLIISVLQILRNMDEKYIIAFKGYGMSTSEIPIAFLVRFALQSLLPTLRFSLTVAIGLSVVAEFLGAQIGLGYIIQSARATYSLDAIIACAILFGLITVVMDKFTQLVWRTIVPWAEKIQSPFDG